jgi:DNA-binding SARP family transcriptional activator/predicted negative regulator of RcsB-dependent stress response
MGVGPSLRIEMLGGLRVIVGDRAVERSVWTRRSTRGVVSLLALAPGHRLNREQIMFALWPDLDPGAAGNNLRKAVHLARRSLDGDHQRATELLVTETETLSLPLDVWTDVGAFRTVAAAARRSSDPSDYQRALDLYGGDLLPDDRYEPWVTPTLDELKAEKVALLSEQAGLLEARGDLDEAAAALRVALVDEPLEEELVVRLLRVLALMGRRHEAADVYERFATTLSEDVGTQPSLETQRLGQEIAAGERLEPEVTAQLWTRIGDLRMRSGDLVGAAAAFESALSAASGTASLAGLHISAARAYLGAHEATRAEHHIDDAESLLPDERSAKARVATLRANVAWERGDLSGADRFARTAIDLSEGGDPEDIAAANEAFAIVCHFLGAWPGGLSEEIDRLGRLPDADSALAGVFDIHHCIGQYHLYGDGLWEHVEEYARETLDHATKLGAVRAQAFAWCLLGESLLLQARYEEAEGCLERSGELHASLGERSGALAWQRLAELLVCRGESDAAAQPLRRASAIATVSPMAPHLWGRIYATHALMALQRDDPGEAVRHSQAAAKAAARYGDCPTCSSLLNPLAAEAYSLLGDADGARPHAESARRVAAMFRSSAWQAMAETSSGALIAAEGDRPAARAAFEAAAGHYDAAGQPYWAARTRDRADILA